MSESTANDWRECSHHFIFYFGPVMVCRYCNASTIASVDGKSKPIYPPVDEHIEDAQYE